MTNDYAPGATLIITRVDTRVYDHTRVANYIEPIAMEPSDAARAFESDVEKVKAQKIVLSFA